MKKVILITGAGFLCKELLKKLLINDGIHVRVFSRTQKSLEKVDQTYPNKANLTLIQGDIKEQNSLLSAMQNVDEVIHTAAEKRIDYVDRFISQSNAINVTGTDNVCFAAHQNKVKRVLFISTDKAYRPELTYGYQKAEGERLVLGWNNQSATTDYSVCRYGNVWGSTGSVIELWDYQAKEGITPTLTHADMTRFFISPQQAADFVFKCLGVMRGNEVFIPKLKSVKMKEIIEKKLGVPYDIIGLRGKEKIHESLDEGYRSDKKLVSYEKLLQELKKEGVELCK